ncbi:uncharacterized protein LOC109198359 isoform X1 [Oreochromis niloticus]|uniref:uncharacterized protein LOC109198359 isoform X1 n=1 Tax=Oreochromis niloticus TaxID=8128 RepID=UPI0009051333|nr:uncharacterized protein LOC109198359 isoform X1 [Oreochromis niloticus]
MVPPRPAGFQAGIRVAGRLWGMTEAITLLILAVQTGLIELQEFVEALPCSFSLSLPADLSSVHGLYDLPVLPHGLLASHHHLLLNPHLSPGAWHSVDLLFSSWWRSFVQLQCRTWMKSYIVLRCAWCAMVYQRLYLASGV